MTDEESREAWFRIWYCIELRREKDPGRHHRMTDMEVFCKNDRRQSHCGDGFDPAELRHLTVAGAKIFHDWQSTQLGSSFSEYQHRFEPRPNAVPGRK